ncbi:hypothetical protein F5Y12DRAFT_431297 [Xylaria sp. FL1777]|nr:hypothetical protein F5Y12DRAFT_431297 [Xylaria sp. FL1777]
MPQWNLLLVLFSTLSRAFSPAWLEDWPSTQQPLSSEDDVHSCQISHVTRHDMARGPERVQIVTSDTLGWDWEQPAIDPMNSTAGEQWEFDGVSSDGTQAFIFGVYRDPNYSFLGTGNLRVHVEFVFGDGSRYAVVDYAEEATVTTCQSRGTRGVWKGPGFVYTFEITEEMSRARWTMESADVNATVEMKSLSRPRYPDNTMWSKERAQGPVAVVPHFFWAEPIPTADVKVEVAVKATRHSWTGVGGHERLWAAFNWRTCLRNLKIVRLQSGPFSLSLWEFGSSRVPDVTFSSVAMFENGEKIFGVAGTSYGNPAAEVEVVEEGGNRLELRRLYDGRGITTEHLRDKVTGLEVRLERPKEGLEWVFTVTFKKIGFEYVLTEGRGGTGYAGVVSGGRIGSQDEQGPAFVEIMRLPDGDWWLLPDNYVD